MKQRLRIQLVLVFSLLLMIPVLSFAQSKTASGSQPAPYPNLKSTGNPEADIKQHQKDIRVLLDQKAKEKNVYILPLSISVNCFILGKNEEALN